MIHMRSEIAQSLTWVPPKDANDAKMSPKSYLSPAETKALNIESGLLLYWPWVEAICPIVWRSACRMWKSIWINFLSIDTNKSLFPEFCILTLKLPLSLHAVFHISLKSQRIPMWAPNHKHLFIASSCGSQVEPKGSWKPSGRRRVELCSSLFIKMVMVMELEENMAPIGVIFVYYTG